VDPERGNRIAWLDWAFVVAVSVGVGWSMGQIGVPSGYLFAALLTGLA
jgi:hypothetical protein